MWFSRVALFYDQKGAYLTWNNLMPLGYNKMGSGGNIFFLCSIMRNE